MDAQELPQSLTIPNAAVVCPLTEDSCGCAARCCPCTGRPNCSLCIIDSLLSATPGQVRGEDIDDLLELRFLLRHRHKAEPALALFCSLRRRLEQCHYMDLYRLRRWFECNLHAVLTAHDGTQTIAPVQLRFYCVEAIRRDCLCAALSQGQSVPLGSSLAFAYKVARTITPYRGGGVPTPA